MRVRVRCFASLREVAPERTVLELPSGALVADAWAALASSHPGLVPHRNFVRPARAAAYAGWNDPLADGDEVAFLPPVSGGATTALSGEPIDVAALERGVARSGHGAVVTFVGRARDVADDGRAVLDLEYEAYPDMATRVLDAIADEAEARWPVLVAVVHRTGYVPIAEAAVAIVTAGVHRAEAYEANRFVIEAIKERLPIWKRERFDDGTEWKRPGA